jgi:hypothetical protein
MSNVRYCGRLQGEVRGLVIEGRYLAAHWLHPRAVYGLHAPTRRACGSLSQGLLGDKRGSCLNKRAENGEGQVCYEECEKSVRRV